MNKRFLVVGGLGFIGHHLVRQLIDEGKEVAVIDPAYTSSPFKDYMEVLVQRREHIGTTQRGNIFHYYNNTVEGNLDQIFQNHHPEVVIHLGTPANAKDVHDNPWTGRMNTWNGSLRLLESSYKFGVNLFGFVSSSMVYGGFLGRRADEFHPTQPNTEYGKQKLAVENLCKIYHDIFDMDYVIFRPSAVYGTRDTITRVISKMAVKCFQEGKIQVNGRLTELDFSWVEDVATCMRLGLTNSNARNKIFNCTRGRARSLTRAAELVRDYFGKGEIEIVEPDGFYPKRGCLDISRAWDHLGYRPTMNIEEGIPKYLDWLTRQEHFLKLGN